MPIPEGLGERACPEATHDLLTNVYRAALTYERTGDPPYLTCLAADTLVTLRLHSDPEHAETVTEAPGGPGDPASRVDVMEMLARYGL